MRGHWNYIVKESKRQYRHFICRLISRGPRVEQWTWEQKEDEDIAKGKRTHHLVQSREPFAVQLDARRLGLVPQQRGQRLGEYHVAVPSVLTTTPSSASASAMSCTAATTTSSPFPTTEGHILDLPIGSV